MQKRRCFGGFWFVVVLLLAAWPVLAQVQPEAEAGPEPILRIVVSDLTVQGEQDPNAVREAVNGILPHLIDCLRAEYDRGGKVPQRTMLRFNLNSNGKVVWSKVIEPPTKSLDACLAKVLPKIQLPPAGTGLSRVTIVLTTKMDHLLAP